MDLNVQIAGEGMPMIWGHGLMSSIQTEDMLDWFQWKDMPKGVRLVRYDARGHGKSPSSHDPKDYGWSNLGTDMLAIADAAQATQFIAGGASMGCATAICAALQAPSRIKALVLVIPPTIWETRAEQGKLYQRLALLGSLLGGETMGKLASRDAGNLKPSFLAKAEPEKLQEAARGFGSLKRRTIWNLFRGAAMTDLPPRETLRALADIPTLILGWIDDPSHPVSSAQELHRLLPRSELSIAQGYEEFRTIPQRLRDFVSMHA
jgi:pimeloyl-ACP methyl ester carboxylesterase